VPFSIQALPNFNGIQVGGSLTANLTVYKIPLLNSDNPQFYVFDWVSVSGTAPADTNDLTWPDMAVPLMFYQSGNKVVAPGIYTVKSAFAEKQSLDSFSSS